MNHILFVLQLQCLQREGGREGKKVQNLQVNCSVSKQAKRKKDVA